MPNYDHRTVNTRFVLPHEALKSAMEAHTTRDQRPGNGFAVLKPLVRIETNDRVIADIPDHFLWRISDLDRGWLAGVLFARQPADTPDAALTALLGTMEPQIIYPTLSNPTEVAEVTGTDLVSLPTKVMLGCWSSNMDQFIVAQEVDGNFTHGWGEPTVRNFQAVATMEHTRYL